MHPVELLLRRCCPGTSRRGASTSRYVPAERQTRRCEVGRGRIAVGGLGTDPEKRTKTRRYLSDTVLRSSNDNTEICRGSYYAKRDAKSPANIFIPNTPRLRTLVRMLYQTMRAYFPSNSHTFKRQKIHGASGLPVFRAIHQLAVR